MIGLGLVTFAAAACFAMASARNWTIGARFPAVLDGLASLSMVALTATIATAALP